MQNRRILDEDEGIRAMSEQRTADERISDATDLAFQYAGIDGAHHKQWVIDQMLRKLLGSEEYGFWVLRWESEGVDETDKWDTGIAP